MYIRTLIICLKPTQRDALKYPMLRHLFFVASDDHARVALN